mgnify:FL=1
MDLLALSVILSFMILMFSGCQMASGTLSEKEITVFNTEFFNGDITNMNNMLLSSEYSQPDEINLFELFIMALEERLAKYRRMNCQC